MVQGLPRQRHGAPSKGNAGDEQVMVRMQQHAIENQIDALVGDTGERRAGDGAVVGGLGDARVVQEAANALLLRVLGGRHGQGTGEIGEMGRLGLGGAGDDQGQGIKLAGTDGR
jgi:hypothetical protein